MAILGALGDLVLALSADTAKFQSDLGRAQRVADKFGREVGRALGNVAGALVALGGAAGFTGLVKGQIDAADAAGKMGQKIGMSTEAWSMYMVAGRLADLTNEQLQTGFQQLAKNQADFVAGTGEAASAFLALGISQEQIKALNGDNAKLFEMVAGKLASFADGANKTAIAMKIFGRSGAELIPMINELERTRKEAEMLGAVIDKDTAAAAERFNDNLTRVGIAVQAVGLSMARGMLPVLEQVTEEMVKSAKAMNEFSFPAQAAKVIFQTLAVLGANVVFVFKGIGTEIGGIAAQLSRLAVLDFEGFAAIGKSMKEEAARARAEFDAFEAKIMGTTDSLSAMGDATAKKAAPALRNLAAEAKEAEERFKNLSAAINAGHADALAWTEAGIEAQKAMEKAFGETLDRDDADMVSTVVLLEDANEQIFDIEKLTEKAGKRAQEFGFTFNSALEDAIINGSRLSDVVRALEQDIARMIVRKAVTEPLGNAVAGAVGGINFGKLFERTDFGLSSALEGMQARAGGGPVSAGDPFLVGERGPELFVPGRNGAVVPNSELGGVTINQTINVDSRSDRAVIDLAMRRAKDEAVAEIRHLQQTRGDARV